MVFLMFVLQTALQVTPPATPAAGPSAQVIRLADRLSRRSPRSLDVYYSIRTKLSPDDIKALRVELLNRAMVEGGIRPRELYSVCREPEWFWKARSGLDLALAATSEDDWRATRRQAEAGLDQLADLQQGVLSGKSADRTFGAAANLARQARQAPAGRGRQILQRAARDQFGRSAGAALRRREIVSNDLTGAARVFVSTRLELQMCQIDLDNSAWLKRDIATHGWPRISTQGKAVDHAAWLLVQHADHDTDFQGQALGQLEALASQGETDTQNFAYLFDRVAVAANRPQRYATQGRCARGGVWEPLPMEEPAKVDERRAAMRMPPLAQYRSQFRSCVPSAPPGFPQ